MVKVKFPEKKMKIKRRDVLFYLTLSESTSDRTSLIVASSPIPYSFNADSSSSIVMYLGTHFDPKKRLIILLINIPAKNEKY